MRLLHVKFSNPFDAYSPLLLLEAAEFALIPIGKERYQEPSGCHCRQSRSAKRVDDPSLVESRLELAFNGVIRDLISTTARKGAPIAIFWTWAIRHSITKSAFELCGCRIFRSQKYRSLNLNDKETIAFYLFYYSSTVAILGQGSDSCAANGLAIARRYILFSLLEFLPSAYLVDDADDGADY